jgi:hypothetical protein
MTMEKKEPVTITLTLPYHPKLAFILNDPRAKMKTKLKNLIVFMLNLPLGYGGFASINMEIVDK